MTRRALVPLALALACDLPEVGEVGVHVEVAADPGLTMCGGTLAHMDEFVARLAAAFSRAAPTGEDRFRFYWLVSEGFHERSGCPETALACAPGATSFSPVVPINHELVHNLADAVGHPRPFFAEGLAVAFEGLGSFWPDRTDDRPDFFDFGPIIPDDPADELDIRDLIDARTGSLLGEAGGYSLAGAFTAFLIRSHGIDAYLRAYAEMGHHASSRSVDRVFRDVFGVSLEQSVVDFDAGARDCLHTGFDAKLVECSAPELPWEGSTLTHHRSLACDQADAVGPFDGDSLVVFHTVTVAEAGGYELRVVGDDPDDAVALHRCGDCEEGSLMNQAGAPPVVGWLEPGRYALRLRGPSAALTTIGLRLSLVPDWTPPEEPAEPSSPP